MTPLTVLLSHPEAVDVLQSLPTEWDETIVLDSSRIGAMAAFARRKNDRWYVFAVNGDEAAPVDLTIPLSVLGPATYDVTLVADVTATQLSRTEAAWRSSIGRPEYGSRNRQPARA